jgi:single-stranded DNA-specific DHH superfamily exonuclease
MSTAKRSPSEMPKRLVELSEDAQEALIAMIEYGLNHGIGMGMDEGFDLKTDQPHPFRKELEQLVRHFQPTTAEL